MRSPRCSGSEQALGHRDFTRDDTLIGQRSLRCCERLSWSTASSTGAPLLTSEVATDQTALCQRRRSLDFRALRERRRPSRRRIPGPRKAHAYEGDPRPTIAREALAAAAPGTPKGRTAAGLAALHGVAPRTWERLRAVILSETTTSAEPEEETRRRSRAGPRPHAGRRAGPVPPSVCARSKAMMASCARARSGSPISTSYTPCGPRHRVFRSGPSGAETIRTGRTCRTSRARSLPGDGVAAVAVPAVLPVWGRRCDERC